VPASSATFARRLRHRGAPAWDSKEQRVDRIT
jgi:hypothetical protein